MSKLQIKIEKVWIPAFAGMTAHQSTFDRAYMLWP